MSKKNIYNILKNKLKYWIIKLIITYYINKQYNSI